MYVKAVTDLTNDNGGAFVHFSLIFQSKEFEATFRSVLTSMKAVITWIQGLLNASSPELFHWISEKAASHKKDWEQGMFRSRRDILLQDLDTEQIRQAMKASLAFTRFAKDLWSNCQSFMTISCDNSVLVTNGNERRYVQLILENHGVRTELLFKAMFTPTSFKVEMFFYSLSTFHEAVRGRN